MIISTTDDWNSNGFIQVCAIAYLSIRMVAAPTFLGVSLDTQTSFWKNGRSGSLLL